MRELDGMRIMGATDGHFSDGPKSKRRELISAAEAGGRWSLGEVTAEADENVLTHVHPGEPEAFVILDGDLELHGGQGVAHLGPGDVVFIPPDTEHGLRTPYGGRWLAIWPIRERVPGKRYG
ncbi:MAG: cupin domain-containing protein [Chloroflexota bacterium]|nr:cupin domain-containing protein [Chloroflexota bacterium]